MRENRRKKKERTLEEIANSLSLINWKIATKSVLELENKGYQTNSNAHRLQIIGEFFVFLIQVADRLAYEQLDEEKRSRFVTALALRMADIFADNQYDVLGEGEHRKAFIDLLNQRAEDYAELSFHNGEAGFDFMRYFGEQVAAVMKEKHFVSQQVMGIDGPEAIKTLKKGMRDFFKSYAESTTN